LYKAAICGFFYFQILAFFALDFNIVEMRKKKILLHTNNPVLKTGLGENCRYLMEYLLKKCSDKFEVVLFCSQTQVNDPVLQMLPCKAYGSIPADPALLHQLNQDPAKARSVAYGGYYIDEVIQKEKPDIIWMSDDIWSFDGFYDKKYFNKINSVYHITVDSRPVLEEAFKQAEKCPNYFVWTKFAAEEMKKFGPKYAHVKHVYAAFDTEDFKPISKQEKLDWRKKFNIEENTTLFTMMNRNQLRKGHLYCVQAFQKFKKEFPFAKAKLHFHTSYSEKGNGWDIPKMIAYYGIKNEDILCTYICKNCGKWHIAPYQGEDINCPYCGAEKSMITPTIGLGIPDNEMKYMFGIADAGLSIFDSGGFEKMSGASLLCGLPTAITNYSCGEDFEGQPGVTSIKYDTYYQPQTNFIKAASNVESIKNFMVKIFNMEEKQKVKIRETAREWALNTFSTEAIGRQWENIFDKLDYVNWDNYNFSSEEKNDQYSLPSNYKELDNDSYITLLYKEILKMDEGKDGAGRANWHAQIKKGLSREDIYKFFIKTASEENSKNKKVDFSSLIDKNPNKKRALFVIKESRGDCLIATQLFESLHEQHPDTDLYVACDPQFMNIFAGNPYVYKILPYQPFMEQEMICIGAGQNKEDNLFHYYFHPCIGTQRLLNYLSDTNIAFSLTK
jgi:glycosyltransferase involved in cell wall biosynthesis